MEYREMGGKRVSLLGFGCMRFPEKRSRIDEDAAASMLEAAYAGGVNYFDTAWVYHNDRSEDFVGRFLSSKPRDSFFVATKLPCWLVKKPADAERIFAEQLRRLRVDRIDFYLLHALNAHSWDEMERLGVVDVLARLKESGSIGQLGFSFHDGYPTFERIIHARPWDFCQIQYNYMDGDYQAGRVGYELARSLGVPVVVMEPLRGGSLARLPKSVTGPFRSLTPDASDASWAFRWLAGQDGIRVVLSGMSSADQVAENLRVFDKPAALSARELAAFDEVAVEIRSRVRNRCTGCGYCMPCPSGVAIPWNFAVWNGWGMYENAGEARWNWHNKDFADRRADRCVSCGQCVPKCPQGIDIPADLARARAELDGIKRTRRV